MFLQNSRTGKNVGLLLLALSYSLLLSPVFANPFEAELFGESPSGVGFDGNSFFSEPSPSSGSFSEDDFFGSSGSSGSASTFSAGSADGFRSLLLEKESQFHIGGRYYHSVSVIGTDSQSAKESSLGSEGVVDIYFDAALDDDVRFFLKQKISEDFTAVSDSGSIVNFGGPEASTAVEQLWLKFHYQNKLYMTLGKQPTSWGSGFVWAPTDFVNNQKLSPFSLSDQRLGISMMKFHYPMDTQGINLYSVIQTSEVSTIEDVRTLFRAEILGKKTEYAVSFATQSHGQINLGFDVSTGLRWFDMFVNVGFTKNDQSVYYEAPAGVNDLTSEDLLQLLQSNIDGGVTPVPENAQLNEIDRSDEIIRQLSTGFIYMKGFDDSSQLIVNGEFFYNEKGYDDSDALTLILLQNPGAFDPLYFSKRYAALGFTRAGLGRSSQSYGVQYLKNLSDTTGAMVLNFAFSPYRPLRFSSNVILFTGQDGTFRPFSGDADVLQGTVQLVAEGGLDIPEGIQANIPAFIDLTGADPVQASIQQASFEGPRYIISGQLSLSF